MSRADSSSETKSQGISIEQAAYRGIDQDLYSILGIAAGKQADEADIRRCYRQGALMYHPGK